MIETDITVTKLHRINITMMKNTTTIKGITMVRTIDLRKIITIGHSNDTMLLTQAETLDTQRTVRYLNMKMYRVTTITISIGLMAKETIIDIRIIEITSQDLLPAGTVVKMVMFREFAGMIVLNVSYVTNMVINQNHVLNIIDIDPAAMVL